MLRRAKDGSPGNAKARYRAAQAHAGAGELKAASRALIELLGLEGQQNNREARQLLDNVKRKSNLRRAAEQQQDQRRRIEIRLKDEAEAEDKADEAVRRDEDLRKQREEAAVRVREPPKLGARVSVYWPGDLKWEEGEVVEVLPAEKSNESVKRLQHKVRYDDGFEHVHDLCSGHRHAFEYKLVRKPLSRLTLGSRRVGKLVRRALNMVGIKPETIGLESIVSVAFMGLILSPAFVMLYAIATGQATYS